MTRAPAIAPPGPARPPKGPAPRRPGIALCLALVMAGEIAVRLTEADAARALTWGAMLVTLVAAWRQLGLREAYLVGLCLALSAGLLALAPAPLAAMAAALDQAGFLMAFILLLGLLQEAASSSPSVAACGAFLTRQPPARRYHALGLGTAAMAVLFNIGVVSLLVPLIQRGIEAGTPGDALNPVRERRQIRAMLRGFAWSVTWSPTAIAPLALLELLPGADRATWAKIGLCVFGLMAVIGAVEDGVRFRAVRPSGVRRAAPFPRGAAWRFLAACLTLLAVTLAVVAAAGETVIFGLMLACPIVMLAWIAVQALGPGGGVRAVRARLSTIALAGVPGSVRVAVTLAASGYVGRAAAALVPAEAVARAARLEAMPDFVLLSLLPVAIAALSLLALSPIVMAVFFGSLFAALPVLPADPTLIALSISCGWALSMTVSPFATVVLVIARVGDVAPTTATWRWNLGFSILAALALWPIFAVLTRGH